MKLLPFEMYCLRTKLPPEEILKRLQKELWTREEILFNTRFKTDKPESRRYLLGRIVGSTFIFRRNSFNTRDSVFASVEGEINKKTNGTEISIIIHLNKDTKKLLSVVFGILGLVVIFSIKTFSVIYPIIFSLWIYIILITSFNDDRKWIKENLWFLFEGEEVY